MASYSQGRKPRDKSLAALFILIHIDFEMSNETKQIEEPQVSTINLPIDLVKKFKKNLEPLAVSLLIKHSYGDSLFKGLSVRTIANLCNCGKTRAQRIIKNVKSENLLFHYSERKNILLARSYKSYFCEDDTSNGNKMIHAYCVKFSVSDGDSVSTIITKIQNALICNAINATERTDSFTTKRRINKNLELTSKQALTRNKFANIIGTSRTTASKHVGKLIYDNFVSFNKGYCVLVMDVCNKEVIEMNNYQNIKFRYDVNSSMAYATIADEYHIADRRLTEKFRHIILNHPKRIYSKNVHHVKNAPIINKITLSYKDSLAQYN